MHGLILLRYKVPDACSYVYRICGSHDLQRCICFPQHLLKEGNDNGEECRWDELLRLPQHDVTCILDTLCFCCWGPKDVDYWLEHSHSTTWQQSFLVPTFSLKHYSSNLQTGHSNCFILDLFSCHYSSNELLVDDTCNQGLQMSRTFVCEKDILMFPAASAFVLH